MGSKGISAPLNRASGLPLTQAERETEAHFRDERLVKERNFLKLCRQLGVPPGQPSQSLRKLWARIQGDREDAA